MKPWGYIWLRPLGHAMLGLLDARTLPLVSGCSEPSGKGLTELTLLTCDERSGIRISGLHGVSVTWCDSWYRMVFDIA